MQHCTRNDVGESTAALASMSFSSLDVPPAASSGASNFQQITSTAPLGAELGQMSARRPLLCSSWRVLIALLAAIGSPTTVHYQASTAGPQQRTRGELSADKPHGHLRLPCLSTVFNSQWPAWARKQWPAQHLHIRGVRSGRFCRVSASLRHSMTASLDSLLHFRRGSILPTSTRGSFGPISDVMVCSALGADIVPAQDNQVYFIILIWYSR
jgi:hypothetical protein